MGKVKNRFEKHLKRSQFSHGPSKMRWYLAILSRRVQYISQNTRVRINEIN